MDDERTRRVALVTGASGGIGRAIAIRLARDDFELMLAGRNEERLAATADAVATAVAAGRSSVDGVPPAAWRDGGGPHGASRGNASEERDTGRAGDRSSLLVVDLASDDSPRAVATAVASRYGRLDVLVNNAGLAPGGPFSGYSFDDWDATMAINARAPFFLTQALLPMLRQAAPGYVINIGSVVSKRGYAEQALYTASKHALLGWTKALAREVPTRELRVHAVLPGGVDTPMIRGVRPDIDPEELIAPQDIADVVAGLVAMRGNAVIDEVAIRRQTSTPW